MIDEVLAGRHTPPTEMDVAHDAIAVAYSLIQRHSDAFVGETADAKGAETAANVVASVVRIGQTSALSARGGDQRGGDRRGGGWDRRDRARARRRVGRRVLSGRVRRFLDRIVRRGDAPPRTPFLGPHLGDARLRGGQIYPVRATLRRARRTHRRVARGVIRATPHTFRRGRIWERTGLRLRIRGVVSVGGRRDSAHLHRMKEPADSHREVSRVGGFESGARARSRRRGRARRRAAAAIRVTPFPAPADGDGDDAEDAEEEPLDATAGALSDELTSRVLRILWSNWEDPLSQTVKEVQAAFEEMVDAKTGASASPEEARRFLSDAAARLLAKDASSKGRYVPLATLVPRLGARNLLAIRPEVLSETFAAMRDDSVCTAAATLVSALSARLLREMQENTRAAAATSASASRPGGAKEVCVDAGGGPAVAAWRSWWIPPLLAALLSPGREKVGVAKYALPALVRQDGSVRR